MFGLSENQWLVHKKGENIRPGTGKVKMEKLTQNGLYDDEI